MLLISEAVLYHWGTAGTVEVPAWCVLISPLLLIPLLPFLVLVSSPAWKFRCHISSKCPACLSVLISFCNTPSLPQNLLTQAPSPSTPQCSSSLSFFHRCYDKPKEIMGLCMCGPLSIGQWFFVLREICWRYSSITQSLPFLKNEILVDTMKL